MTISEAKQQIINAMKAYFTKDEFGNFKIPREAQRPVFLMGPPGIGKTAIMKQVADELGVGLISYSMTHHTRQSALGLPVIVKKSYGGKEYDVSEYTMSEIIASVYDMIEEAGAKEGILFLDEINCVSETLTPTMLQFLQYKTFGKHAVPDGWLVVTAGNPPEYNRSVREFDIVTWDRLKRIDIEPDYSSWKDFAVMHGVHPSVLTYLDAKKNNFYRIEADADGKRFVTARGWVDLSDMIWLYEENQIPIDKILISQYLQNAEIAEDFASYYDLFNKYKSDYKINEILSGTVPQDILSRSQQAPFDERLSLIGLLLDNVTADIRSVVSTEDVALELLPALKDVKSGASIESKIEEISCRMARDERRGTMSLEKLTKYERVLDFLGKCTGKSFDEIKKDYDTFIAAMKSAASAAGEKLENLFTFAENAWGNSQEILIIVTELTTGGHSARFISRYGCDSYYRHNEQLMFYERNAEIIKQLEEMEDYGIE